MVTVSFDPHRDVSVVSGPFSVDVNELCAEHTLLTYKKLLIIQPARGALTTALWEAEAATPANPQAGTALADAIRGALAALDALESHIDELLWKLQDASLTYGDAEAGASLWEVVPGSPMGPQLTPIGVARFYATGGLAGAVSSALFHGQQDVAHDLGLPWLPTVLNPSAASFVGNRDLINSGIDGLLFYVHKDDMSGARFQRDLGRFALDVNSLPVFRDVARNLSVFGVSQDLNSTSTASSSGIAALGATLLTALGGGKRASYGVAIKAADGDTRVHYGGIGLSLWPGRVRECTEATLESMPDAAPDTHYEGAATSADLIEHITDMHGGDADNGEIAIEEHVTVGEDGTQTRSWTVDIRGTQSFDIGQTGPQDMTTNLQGVGGMPSDQLAAIQEAMKDAGIAPGEAVEFAGHSQGGIMAAQLAADPDVRSRYNIVSVVTAGSPTATIAPTDVPVLSYENSGDIVPGLDGYATQGDNVTTVMFHDYQATCDGTDPVPCSHSAPVYVEEIRSSLNAAKTSTDPGLGALAAAEARRTQALGLTERTQTTIHHYQTRRITDK
ncbi:alpha/beta hydrolase [uncultured Actinomyces sp.]|uniref:alpha/beta hydrolase n=1 Tax=uncultured Actinomyces sp. TaxID=249061 RepID=UPI0028F03822|nr:alpha/beta hydrolase [uncultured Actinomyces sp.]